MTALDGPPLPASKNVSACLLLPLDKHPLFQALDTLPHFPHRWTKLFYQIVAYGPRQQIWIFLVPTWRRSLKMKNEGINLKSTVSEDCNYITQTWMDISVSAFECEISIALCKHYLFAPPKTFALVLVAPLGSFFDEIRPGSWTLAMSLSS